MKKTIIFLLSIFILFSCGKNSDEKIQIYQKSNENISNNLEKNELYKEIKVKYDNDSEVLNIWEIQVRKWFNSDIFWEFLPPDWEVTYINSSLDKQYFFVSKKTQDEIKKYYIAKSKWLWYKLLESKWNSIIFEKTPDNQDLFWVERLNVSFLSEIPENLKPLNLSWLYVEIFKEKN